MATILQTPIGTLTLPSTTLLSATAIFLTSLIISDRLFLHAGHSLFKTLTSLTFFVCALSLLNKTVDPGYPTSWTEKFEAVVDTLSKVEGGKKWLVLGLASSILGDVFLIPSVEEYTLSRLNTKTSSTAAEKTKKSNKPEEAKDPGLRFRIGTFFFALAHIAYTIAFFPPINLTDLLNDPLRTLAGARINWKYTATSLSLGLTLSIFLGLLPPSTSLIGPNLYVPADMTPLVSLYVLIINSMVAVACGTSGGKIGWQRALGAWMFLGSDIFVAVDVFGRGVVGWKARAVGWVLYFFGQVVLGGCVSRMR